MNKSMTVNNFGYSLNPAMQMKFSHKLEGMDCSKDRPSIFGHLVRGQECPARDIHPFLENLRPNRHTVCNNIQCYPSEVSCVCRKEFHTWM
jgi:hypothetical protein